MSNRPKAYSYTRFSSTEQLKGDGLRRQIAAARTYAEAHGLDLDDLTFRDLGVSAFRGINATEGALAAFIDAVDGGKVKPGCSLLVENLDRLSRDRIMPALNRFSALLEKGIRVVTLSDGKVYDSESLDNLPDLMLSLMTMSRAHEESKIKSQRGKANWQNKRDRAAKGDHILTTRAPGWLRVKSGKFVVIEERANIVRRIYKEAVTGHGKESIARRLNTDKVATFGGGKGWRAGYVSKILRNPAVIGVFQPSRMDHENGGKGERVPDGEPIEGYFPAIVPAAIYYKVKQLKPGPSGKSKLGPSGKRENAPPSNLLSGLVFCGKCGGMMHYVSKGYRKVVTAGVTGTLRNPAYLVCDNARRKKSCDALGVQYQSVFQYVIEHLQDFRSFYEASKPSAGDRDRELDEIAAQVAKTEEAIGRLLDTLEKTDSPSALKRLEGHEAKLAALKEQQTELKEKRVIHEAGDDWEAYVEWYNRTVTGEEATEIFLDSIAHTAAEIRRNVDKIILEKGKEIRVIPRSEGALTL